MNEKLKKALYILGILSVEFGTVLMSFSLVGLPFVLNSILQPMAIISVTIMIWFFSKIINKTFIRTYLLFMVPQVIMALIVFLIVI